jgi:hypothetical protein
VDDSRWYGKPRDHHSFKIVQADTSLLCGECLLPGFSARQSPRVVGARHDIGDQIVCHLPGQKAGVVPGHGIPNKVGKSVNPPSLPYLVKRRPRQRWRLASTQIVGMTGPAYGVECVLALQGVAGRHGPAGAERKLFRGCCRRGRDDESNAPPERTYPILLHNTPRLLIQPAGKIACSAAHSQPSLTPPIPC